MRSVSRILLLSKRITMIRRLILTIMCMATFFSVRTVAWSGEIAPELLKELNSTDSFHKHAVIIKLREAVDYQSLKAAAEYVGRRERVKKVVQEIKAATDRSQRDLRSYLAARETLGRVRNVKHFWIFNGIAVSATAEAIQELASRTDVAEIVPDRLFALSAPALASTAAPAGWNLDRIGVRPLWNAGYTGQGVVVANLDTGVDFNQHELGPKWRNGANSWYNPYSLPVNSAFCRIPGQCTVCELSTVPCDVNGHGTQTMGIMTAGNSTDHLIGVAPGAQWIAAKIFNDAGQAAVSTTHQAFQWVLDPDGNGNPNDSPDIVNCSWDLNGSGTGTINLEFQPDVQALQTAGIAVVFSGGNGGPADGTSVSPANYPGSFSVGMTDSTDTVDPQSSRGPSASDGSLYPTVVAPGAGVMTTDLWFGSAALSTVTVNGTSFSAPHVAGAMALLLSSSPTLTLTVGQMEDAIRQTAWDLGTAGPDNSYGYGFLDVERAARQLNVLPPAPAGDVDGSGMLDLNDVLIDLRAAIGFPTSPVEMNRIKSRGDAYPPGAPDNMITPADALTLLRMYVEAH
jgi:serine protease AprX